MLFLVQFTFAYSWFKMQAGYYIWSASEQKIEWLWFKPDLVIIKSSTNSYWVFKTSAMPITNVSYFSSISDDIGSNIVLDQDSFSIKNFSTVNWLNTLYSWVAFWNSSCSSTWSFCVGYYIWDWKSSQQIVTNFQPDLVWIKRSGSPANRWSLSMPNWVAQFFDNRAQDTTANLFKTVNSDWFNVGINNNTNLWVYYYVAFKKTPWKLDLWLFQWNWLDNRDIETLSFKPNRLIIKNSNTTTPAVHNQTFNYWDSSSFFTNATNASNYIQSFLSNWFQVWPLSAVNWSGNNIYRTAFGWVPEIQSSGKFKMTQWYYTGSWISFSLTGLDFSPDLVIIKHDNQAPAQYAVFRTKLMKWNSTAYFSSSSSNFAGWITSLDQSGFSIWTHSTVNKNWDTYYRSAFGNAWNPEKKSGSSDFVIWAHFGNNTDNREISPIVLSPDMVAIKSISSTQWMRWNSDIIGDFSHGFGALAGASNYIQKWYNNWFQLWNNTYVNWNNILYNWFAFKKWDNFAVETYIWNWSSQDVNSVWFKPDLIRIKSTNSTQWVMKSSLQSGDKSQSFSNYSTLTDVVKDVLPSGFQVWSRSEVNTNSVVYRYASWKIPDTTAPILLEITPIWQYTWDSTPKYTINSSEAGNLEFVWDCSSNTNYIQSWNTKIEFNSLEDWDYNNCKIYLTDLAWNKSSALSVSDFYVDTALPNLSFADTDSGVRNQDILVNAINYDTWAWIWHTWVLYLINQSFWSDCLTGFTTNPFLTGEWTFEVQACTKDNAQNTQIVGQIYNIDKTAPLVSNIIISNTQSSTPDLSFETNESWQILRSWVCSSATVFVSSGIQSIKLSPLWDWNYENCFLTMKDLADNTGIWYKVPNFSIKRHTTSESNGWSSWWGSSNWSKSNDSAEFVSSGLENEQEAEEVETDDFEQKDQEFRLWDISNSHYSEELNESYLYAYRFGITTKSTIQEAELDKPLVRADMAKMITSFMTNVLKKQPEIISDSCNFEDISEESDEIKFYIQKSCQLWLMWIDINAFNPRWVLTRWEFATVLSRSIYWDLYEWWEDFYTKHLEILKEKWIIKYTDPSVTELRWYTFLMMMRVRKNM